jgi:glycosyltransferase involved in cell wall biosynthesis
MVKILLVADFGMYGGTRTFFESLVEFYSSLGCELIVAVAPIQVDAALEGLLGRVGGRILLLPERGSHLRQLWHRMPFTVLFELYAILPIVWKERPDLLVISSAVPGHYLGMVLLPCRFLYILHTLPSGTSKSRVEKSVFRRYVGVHKRLVAVSHYARRKMIEYWLVPGQEQFVSMIHNSTGKKGAARCKIADGGSDVSRVLTVGHVAWYKNPLSWIEVARRVIELRPDRPIEFVWIGDGDLHEECKVRVEREGLEGIRFIGFRRDLEHFYASSQVYFQPSLMENHSLAVLDAMSFGLPCVVSDVGGLPESVSDGATGYVVPAHDLDGMVRRILALIDDPELRVRMGSSARDVSEASFSHERWIEKMTVLHRELLADAGG